MATYNKTERTHARNISGHAAYGLDDRTRLVGMVLTSMVNEAKYYGDNTESMIGLAESLCRRDGEFVAKLAIWARTRGNMRTVSHVLCAVVGHCCSGEPFVRPMARVVASARVDDGTEILATHKMLYGDKVRWPHALQRGVADALGDASPTSLARWQSKSREWKLRDTLRVTHPRPLADDLDEAMGKAVAMELPMPKSWETEVSGRGNTKEVWDELVAENRLGTMALLRNLRNIIRSGADMGPVLARLSNPDAIRRSRLLPFRFVVAYKELMNENLVSKAVFSALDDAMIASCENADQLPGSTAILIDSSGSMGMSLSEKSVATCIDVAATFGAMACHLSDDAWVCQFDITAKSVPMSGRSILSDVGRLAGVGGWTDMSAGFDLLMRSGFDADRVIVISDNEVNHGRNAVMRELVEYRGKVGHDVWCHAIDVCGYGTVQFAGDKVNYISGWSDSVPRFISMAESGIGSLVDEVEAIDVHAEAKKALRNAENRRFVRVSG